MFAVNRSAMRLPVLHQSYKRMQIAPVRDIKIKVVPASECTKAENFFDKNERLKREMSPHLTIYKPQLTSILSITHRGTGAVLSAYTWALGIGALVTSHDAAHYQTMFEGLQMNSVTLTTVKFVLAFPLAYHTCAGIRHLVWDTGAFLKINEVYMTGYATLALSIVLSVALACL